MLLRPCWKEKGFQRTEPGRASAAPRGALRLWSGDGRAALLGVVKLHAGHDVLHGFLQGFEHLLH